MGRLSGSATALAIWVLLVGTLVFAAVFAGWWLIFEPAVPHPLIAVLLAAGLAVLALMLARLFAEKLAQSKQPGAARIKPHYWLAYVILFIVSGMGTVNAAFVLWEGPSVVRQDMAEVRNAYSALEIFARNSLTSAAHQRKAADLDALLANLREEINNPNGGNYCGVGDAANQIIAQIRAIVPQMPIIRGTGAIRPCDPVRAERVFQAYATSARATLARDSEFLAFNGPRKAEALAAVRSNAAAMRRGFDAVEGLLGDPTAFTRAEVQQPLATAANNYGDDYRRLASLAGRVDEAIPAAVDVTQSQDLGSFAAFFQIFISRIWEPKTWVYLAIAILLDFALVYVLKEAFLRYRRWGRASDIDPYRRRGPHPKFLWVNPPVDPARLEVRHV